MAEELSAPHTPPDEEAQRPETSIFEGMPPGMRPDRGLLPFCVEEEPQSPEFNSQMFRIVVARLPVYNYQIDNALEALSREDKDRLYKSLKRSYRASGQTPPRSPSMLLETVAPLPDGLDSPVNEGVYDDRGDNDGPAPPSPTGPPSPPLPQQKARRKTDAISGYWFDLDLPFPQDECPFRFFSRDGLQSLSFPSVFPNEGFCDGVYWMRDPTTDRWFVGPLSCIYWDVSNDIVKDPRLLEYLGRGENGFCDVLAYIDCLTHDTTPQLCKRARVYSLSQALEKGSNFYHHLSIPDIHRNPPLTRTSDYPPRHTDVPGLPPLMPITDLGMMAQNKMPTIYRPALQVPQRVEPSSYKRSRYVTPGRNMYVRPTPRGALPLIPDPRRFHPPISELGRTSNSTAAGHASTTASTTGASVPSIAGASTTGASVPSIAGAPPSNHISLASSGITVMSVPAHARADAHTVDTDVQEVHNRCHGPPFGTNAALSIGARDPTAENWCYIILRHKKELTEFFEQRTHYDLDEINHTAFALFTLQHHVRLMRKDSTMFDQGSTRYFSYACFHCHVVLYRVTACYKHYSSGEPSTFTLTKRVDTFDHRCDISAIKEIMMKNERRKYDMKKKRSTEAKDSTVQSTANENDSGEKDSTEKANTEEREKHMKAFQEKTDKEFSKLERYTETNEDTDFLQMVKLYLAVRDENRTLWNSMVESSVSILMLYYLKTVVPDYGKEKEERSLHQLGTVVVRLLFDVVSFTNQRLLETVNSILGMSLSEKILMQKHQPIIRRLVKSHDLVSIGKRDTSSSHLLAHQLVARQHYAVVCLTKSLKVVPNSEISKERLEEIEVLIKKCQNAEVDPDVMAKSGFGGCADVEETDEDDDDDYVELDDSGFVGLDDELSSNTNSCTPDGIDIKPMVSTDSFKDSLKAWRESSYAHPPTSRPTSSFEKFPTSKNTEEELNAFNEEIMRMIDTCISTASDVDESRHDPITYIFVCDRRLYQDPRTCFSLLQGSIATDTTFLKEARNELRNAQLACLSIAVGLTGAENRVQPLAFLLHSSHESTETWLVFHAVFRTLLINRVVSESGATALSGFKLAVACDGHKGQRKAFMLVYGDLILRGLLCIVLCYVHFKEVLHKMLDKTLVKSKKDFGEVTWMLLQFIHSIRQSSVDEARQFLVERIADKHQHQGNKTFTILSDKSCTVLPLLHRPFSTSNTFTSNTVEVYNSMIIPFRKTGVLKTLLCLESDSTMRWDNTFQTAIGETTSLVTAYGGIMISCAIMESGAYTCDDVVGDFTRWRCRPRGDLKSSQIVHLYDRYQAVQRRNSSYTTSRQCTIHDRFNSTESLVTLDEDGCTWRCSVCPDASVDYTVCPHIGCVLLSRTNWLSLVQSTTTALLNSDQSVFIFTEMFHCDNSKGASFLKEFVVERSLLTLPMRKKYFQESWLDPGSLMKLPEPSDVDAQRSRILEVRRKYFRDLVKAEDVDPKLFYEYMFDVHRHKGLKDYYKKI